MKTLLLVSERGEGFSPHTSSGRRLALMAGVANIELYAYVINLLDPKRFDAVTDPVRRAFIDFELTQKRKWPMQAARTSMYFISVPQHVKHVWLLGRQVANTFDFPRPWTWGRQIPMRRYPTYDRFGECDNPVMCEIWPHPSGLNCLYNDPELVDKVTKRIKECLTLTSVK